MYCMETEGTFQTSNATKVMQMSPIVFELSQRDAVRLRRDTAASGFVERSSFHSATIEAFQLAKLPGT
jgi:hypothetical protein